MERNQQQSVEELAERMRRFMQTRGWSKEQALQFLMGAGIATPGGELAPEYRCDRGESISVEQARSQLAAAMDRGTQCPCCDQFVKRYRRKLNSGLAALLVRVYSEVSVRDSEGGWLHIRDAVKDLTGTDYAILRHFGLLEPYQQGGRRGGAGLWRLTEKGTLFVEGKTSVPEAVYLLNNKVHGYSPQTISIQEALGNAFDWDELMGRSLLGKAC
ncbi:hypothetical protein [Geoalkalibacter subterraneus]|uniref:Uncharacterized protein n=1 Tax=Geoalkalibacter subterraneus TaxID=483547 RepID=A0A0B5FJD7_9BACT|nr:hypothetical protein [Geoalkalibacter subterraneus]AJF08282.1 hypothetical protein GSUB_17555 [Geoalkalibacter subterraneus]